MGMYDYIICHYQLPGQPPSFCANTDHRYQTKSLDCVLTTYEITETGELKQVGPDWSQELVNPETVPFDGVLEFYDGNLTACAFGVSFTANGEDSEWVSYEATFVNGMVQSIVETERERKPALARHLLAEIDAKFNKDMPEVTMNEPEIGQPMYLRWGVSTKGYAVTIVATTQEGWTVADEKGTIHRMRRPDLGRLLFHSQEESDRLKAWREKTEALKTAHAKQLLRAQRGG